MSQTQSGVGKVAKGIGAGVSQIFTTLGDIAEGQDKQLINKIRKANFQSSQQQAQAGDIVSSVFTQETNKSLQDLQDSGIIGPGDLANLSRAERAAKLMEYQQGQGNRKLTSRFRIISTINALKTESPALSAEIDAAFKKVSGKSFGEYSDTTLEQSQKYIREESDQYVKDLREQRTKIGFSPDTPLTEVASYLRKQEDANLYIHNVNTTLNVLKANKELTTARLDGEYSKIGGKLITKAHSALNDVLGEIDDPSSLTPEQRQAAIANVRFTFDKIASNTAQTFSDLNKTPNDVATDFPILADTRDQVIDYINGKTDANALKNWNQKTLELIKNDAFEKDPDLAKFVVGAQWLKDVPDGIWQADAQMARYAFPMIEKIHKFLPPQDDGAGGNVGGKGESYLGGTDKNSFDQDKQQQAGVTRNLLKLIDFHLKEGVDAKNLTPTQQNSIVMLNKMVDDMSKDSDRVPVDTLKELSKFIGSSPDAIHQIDAVSDKASDVQKATIERNMKSMFGDYLMRTADSMEQDLNATIRGTPYTVAERKPKELFSFLGISFTAGPPQYAEARNQQARVVDTMDYELTKDGTLVFTPLPAYANNNRVREKAQELNAKYSNAFRNQVRSYAHIVDKDTNYKEAFLNMLQSSSFEENNLTRGHGEPVGEKLLFDRFRNDPQYSSLSDQEIRDVIQNGGS